MRRNAAIRNARDESLRRRYVASNLEFSKFDLKDHFFARDRIEARRIADHKLVAVKREWTDEVELPDRIPGCFYMVHDLAILQSVSSDVGKHRIEETDLFFSGWRGTTRFVPVAMEDAIIRPSAW
jgi:hypothetical protein